MNSLLTALKKIDRYFDRHTSLLVLFLLIIILRLPNFFEPYWYGDEAIYLTLGNALREGGQLYTTIIDHKTPLIYYLAMVPNQFYFRLLNLAWMLVTTAFFYKFAKTLFQKTAPTIIASLVMVLLTTLPWLEGHIPNGELFVMGFVMVGAVLFSRSSVWREFFAKSKSNPTQATLRDYTWLAGAGFMMGLGILTKVPALLDVAAFLSIFWLLLMGQILTPHTTLGTVGDKFLSLLRRGLAFGGGLLLPILLSVIYFVSVGSGQDYLEYGLLYNFRYSQSWSHDFGSALLNFIFSMPGKTLVLFGIFFLISLNTKELTKRTQFIAVYFIFTLYSVLLSSRPYPHYFLQMVPAFALLVVDMWVGRRAWRTWVLGVGLLAMTGYTLLSFGFKPYAVSSYYHQFYRYATLQISREEYENAFDANVKDNRAITKLIREMGVKKIFIWGTNPLLYAQSQTIPTSRFTVSFHIKDFGDHARTFEQIVTEQPKLIVVMKNETQKFAELESYLDQHYLLNQDFSRMLLYLRQN